MRQNQAADAGKESEVEILGVRLTHPERVLYPQQGLTKRDLAEFYSDIAERVLPHLQNRPLSLVRCPRGRDKKCFFQKHLGAQTDAHLSTVTLTERDKSGQYAVIHDLQGLLSLIQLGVLELHPWGALADAPDRPDRLIFDLDPGAGVDQMQLVDAAKRVRAALADFELQGFLRTSGGKGLHVVVPLQPVAPWDDAKAFTQAVAERIAAQDPTSFVATASKAKRGGKVFIDYLRNTRGATAVASYSTRARPGAPVATPLDWDELGALPAPDYYTVDNLRRRLDELRSDPWAGFLTPRQALTPELVERALITEK